MPCVVYDHVLGDPGRQIYDEALAMCDQFEGPNGSDADICRLHTCWAPHLVNRIVADGVSKLLRSACTALGVAPFRIVRIEGELSASVDGDEYLAHSDVGPGPISRRRVSAVYYYGPEERAFQGGELIVGEGPDAQIVEPIPDRLVFFRSSTTHSVRKVACPSGNFEDSRFAAAIWIHGDAGPENFPK